MDTSLCRSSYKFVYKRKVELLICLFFSRQRWNGEVEVGSDPIKFRYFIGYYLHSGKEGEKNVSFLLEKCKNQKKCSFFYNYIKV